MAAWYECELEVRGRARLTVSAVSEVEAAEKAATSDPLELDIDVLGVTCESVSALREETP